MAVLILRDIEKRAVPERNHHYLPQFHLRQFALSRRDGRVWTYDKQSDQMRPRSVRQVASEPGYYTVHYPERGPDDSLEDLFGFIESAAAPPIKQLAELSPGTHPINATARDLVAGYMAILWSRGPVQRAKVRGMAQLGRLVELDMDLRDPKRFRKRARRHKMRGSNDEIEVQRKTYLADIETGKLTFEAPPEWGLMGLGPAIDDIRPLLTQMRWRVVRRRRFPGLVIGDAPVVLIEPDNSSPFRGVGFATPGVEVCLPLSQQAVLVLTHEPSANEVEVLDPDALPSRPSLNPDWVVELNAKEFMFSDRYVFAHCQGDLEATRLMLEPEQRAWRPKTQVSGLPAEWQRYLDDSFEIKEWGRPPAYSPPR